MSSTAESESSLEELRAAAARVLGREVFELVRIGGGRNSRVYRAVDHTSHRVALKVYFRHANDDRNRLATEFSSLAFLWERGFRNVPHPIGADPEMNLAVYEYIEGEKIAPDNPAISDLDSTIE